MERTRSSTIIITGPESTGKTTIAENLAERFQGKLIPEYARAYISNLKGTYNFKDIINIARWQYQHFTEAKQAKKAHKYFIDTYLIITKIWMLWHAGRYEKWIDKALEDTRDCHYLLCAPDIEWKPDDVRENGGEKRLELFDAYKLELGEI
jgi:nicotinamide riboside kinase